MEVTWLSLKEARVLEKRNTSPNASSASSPKRTSTAWIAYTEPMQQRVAARARTSAAEAAALGTAWPPAAEPSK